MRKVVLVLIVLAAAPLAAGLALAAVDDSGTRAQPAAAAPRAGIPAADKPGSPAGPPASRRPPDADRPEHRGAWRPRTPTIFRDATEEEIADIMAFTGEHLPWLCQDLEKMRQSDPDHFRQTCRRLRFEVSQLRSLKERDAAAFQKAIEERQLRLRALGLASKIRAATDAKEQEALTAALRQVLDKMFDAEMVTREANIRGIEERLETLRQELKARAAHRQEVRQKRLEEMLKGNPESVFAPSERPQPKK